MCILGRAQLARTACRRLVHAQQRAQRHAPGIPSIDASAAMGQHVLSHARSCRSIVAFPHPRRAYFASGCRVVGYGGTFAAWLPFPICFMIPLAMHQSMKHYAPAAPGAPVDACLHRPVRRMISLAGNLCGVSWPLLLHLASACASEDSENKLTGPLTRAIASAGALKDSQNNAWLPLLGPDPPSVLDARRLAWDSQPGRHVHQACICTLSGVSHPVFRPVSVWSQCSHTQSVPETCACMQK